MWYHLNPSDISATSSWHSQEQTKEIQCWCGCEKKGVQWLETCSQRVLTALLRCSVLALALFSTAQFGGQRENMVIVLGTGKINQGCEYWGHKHENSTHAWKFRENLKWKQLKFSKDKPKVFLLSEEKFSSQAWKWKLLARKHHSRIFCMHCTDLR